MATLVDGLGNEELGDAGDPGEKTAQVFVTGSVTTGGQISGLNVYAQTQIQGDNIRGDTVVSGLVVSGGDTRTAQLFCVGSVHGTVAVVTPVVSGTTAVRGGQMVCAGSIQDVNGTLSAVSCGSPGVFGAIIQTGSFLTTAGSLANVAFKRNFAAAEEYVFQAWARSGLQLLDATAAGSSAMVTSGTANSGRHTSGVNVLCGGGAVLFDYLAIGLPA